MKKLLLIFILFLCPLVVLADECKKNDILIETIELSDTKGNIETKDEPTINNNQLNLGLKMNVIGDEVTYKVVIKNTSNNEYVFDKNQIEKEYINYEVIYSDESNTINPGEEKIIYLIMLR